MALVKLQDSRRQVHALALRLGPRFVDAFQRLLPWWRAGRLQELPGSFERLVRDVQRGTRVLQVLCAQGKAARAAGLAARVPACKRSVERFAFKIRLLLTQAQRVGAFWMGALKHRDLLGNEVLSQAYADGEQGDEDEELGEEERGDEAAEPGEDEDEDQRGEGGSEAEDE
ncbi:hypothetical protein H632_c1500p1 [Helicosporidium sp. ATCC 50920]|nr:hypothetical protein H632_c1500p1 [Helicosporidium sp. ATCC 50920]|eukprot:KDD74192.1 hypothetical protein H632_c1500p1 [Helicosporidium sp. ATCC 50920]